MPSRSMKAPKSVRFLTVPRTLSPILVRIEEVRALFGALLLDEFAAGEDDVFAVVVDLDDLEVVGVADEAVEIFRGNDIDLRAGEERLDADIDGEAAFDDGLDLALDDAAFVEDLGDLVPVLFIGGAFLGEDDHAFVVFEADEEHFHFVADLEIFDVVEFRERDDAFGFVADIHEHFAGTDFEDAPFDDAALSKLARLDAARAVPAFLTC